MITFKTINIKSFKSIFNTTLDFSNLQKDFYLLEGINKTVNYASSNGSGKTTLMDAIAYALYGTTVGIYLKKEEYQNKNTNISLRICLSFSIDKNDYTVIRTLDSVQLIENGKDISELNKTDTEAKLQKIIQLTKEEFFCFTYITQYSGGNFLNKTTSEKFNVIKNFLFGEELSKIKIVLDNKIKEYKSNLTDLEKNISKIEGFLESYIEQENSDIKNPNINIEHYENQLSEKYKIKKEIENNILEQKQIKDKYNYNLNEMQNIRKQMLDVKNNLCPLCKQNIKDKKAETSLREKAKNIKSVATTLKEKYLSITEYLNKFDQVTIKNEIEQIEQAVEQQKKYNYVYSNKKELQKKLQIKKDELQQNKIIRNCTEEKLAQLQDLYNYFKTDFIKNLQEIFIKEVENYLNLYCYDSFNKTFSLKFVGNSLELFIGDYPYSYYSGGERQKIDLIFIFAIKTILKNYTNKCTNVLILDESLSGSDSVAFNNTIEIIEKLSKSSNLKTILVSHKENNNITNKIIIERYNDFTNLEITN